MADLNFDFETNLENSNLLTAGPATGRVSILVLYLPPASQTTGSHQAMLTAVMHAWRLQGVIEFSELTAEDIGQQPGNYKKNFRQVREEPHES